MFEVRISYPFDSDFAQRDEELIRLAGRRYNHSGANVSGCDGAERDLIFDVATFEEATAIRSGIESTGEYQATIRER